MSDKKIIVLFRQDLRVHDNPALHAAVKSGSIIPVYVLDEDKAGHFKMGQSSRWWLYHSLKSLSKTLRGKLLFYEGKTEQVLQKLIKKYSVDAVFLNTCYQPFMLARDQHLVKFLQKENVAVEIFQDNLLWQPGSIVKSDQTFYKVFTAFYNACLKEQKSIRSLLSKLSTIEYAKIENKTDLYDLKLIDIKQEFNLEKYWTPGEPEALKKLKYFLEHNVKQYKTGRDFVALKAVSGLSPYLHFGEISIQQVWHKIHTQGLDYATRENVACFLKELIWREFAAHVLFSNPNMPTKNLNEKFDNFSWYSNSANLKAWQHGETGYPIIDAAMKELMFTGSMHNRMRMVVASFLIKNLLIDWRKGQDWFWDMLVDADLASNSFNWQWVAGCGYDAAPFFRIFNPILQAKKFDPEGVYTKTWIPELAKLPLKYLQEPWKAPEDVLKKAGVVLGKTYPKPIVDIATSYRRALDTYKNFTK